MSAAFFVAAALIAASDAPLGLEEVAARQQTSTDARLAAAKDALARSRFIEAADDLHAIVSSDAEPGPRDEAAYLLGKALYRLELYHSALGYFSRILEAGPESRYFAAAMEWCLFISRKMVDDAAVSETLVRYGSTDFPEAYRDEFLFRLARFHLNRGLSRDRMAALPAQDEDDDSVSFSGDLFSQDGGAEADGGISIGQDIFGTGGGQGADSGISIGGDLFGDEDPALQVEGSLTIDSDYTLAERYALRVDENSKYGARAKFIEALVLFQRRQENEALERFKDVVRLSRPDAPHPDERLRELAFFQLARTHFGAQQPTFSSFYYSRIDRDSSQWLDALFEDSWSQFRLGRYEKALGNLLTLHAPFFEDAYFPESRILEAVIYYENCRYPEAKKLLADFMRRYEPILAKLDEIIAERKSSDDYVRLLDELKSDDLVGGASDQSEILARVLELALADRDLNRLSRSLEELRSELERAGEVGLRSDLAAELQTMLDRQVAALSDQAGRAVERRLAEERSSIKSLVQQAIRIDIETARSEQERIESRLRDVQSAPRVLDKTFVTWTDDEKLYWPFEGEYWRDELGTYELTLARSCR